MPDTGAPWNIPYVSGTDLVADWPTDSQTLAEAIADGLDAAGTIKQVVSTTKTDSFTTNSTSFTTVTGLTATITPESTSNKVLAIVSGVVSMSGGLELALFNLVRGSTAIAQPSAGANAATQGIYPNAGSEFSSFGWQYLDSPATTSATTYSVEARVIDPGHDLYIGVRSGNSAYTSVSSITLLEVAA